jgi:hypothetical protein
MFAIIGLENYVLQIPFGGLTDKGKYRIDNVIISFRVVKCGGNDTGVVRCGYK